MRKTVRQFAALSCLFTVLAHRNNVVVGRIANLCANCTDLGEVQKHRSVY
jgi:hypothetical protein